MAKHIHIDKSANRLRLYENDKLVREYRVATGRDPSITPEGTFPIVFKTWNPSWTDPKTGRLVAGGASGNPLGSRWLGLGVKDTRGREYGIHGTNRPSSIGRYITQGCVRMRNRDVEELYPKVPLGTLVTIEK